MKIITVFVLLLLLVPVAFSADKTFKAFQLSYVTMDYIDVSTTLYGISKGYEEANPLAQWYIKSAPLTIAVHTALNLITVELSGFIYKRNKKLGWIVIISLNIIKTYVVYQNIKTLAGKK